MKRTPLLMLMAIAMLAFVSCNSKKGVFIPKEAGFVVAIDGESLNKKMTWEEISKADWFQEGMKEEKDSFARELMKDPEQSGINAKSDLYVFMTQAKGNGYMAFEGGLKDAEKFQAFNLKINEKNGQTAKVTESGDLKMLAMDNNGLVTWNDEHFIYLTSMNTPSYDMENFDMEPVAKSPDSLMKKAKELFSIDEDNSLASDDRFASLLKEEGDMHFWVNAGNLYDLNSFGPMSMLKPMFEGNASASTLNFDEGKITVKSKNYYGKQMTELLEKQKTENVDKALFNRIPSENVAFAMGANFPPEALREILKMVQLDGMANGFLGNFGLTLDDLIKATGGDLLIALTDFKVNEQPATTDPVSPVYYQEDPSPLGGMPEMNFLFATSVGDQASFNKISGIVSQQMQDAPMPMQVTGKMQNNWFAAGNSAQYVDQFLAGSSKSQAFADKIAGHPFGAYVDIQKMIQGMGKQTPAMTESLRFWKDITITGGEFNNGYMVSDMEINLVEGKENSLRQLFQYIGRMRPHMESKKDMEWPMESDTSITYPDTLEAAPY